MEGVDRGRGGGTVWWQFAHSDALSVPRQTWANENGVAGWGGCRVQSVEEQVDFLLEQACSADNLCEMYEGWTPWI